MIKKIWKWVKEHYYALMSFISGSIIGFVIFPKVSWEFELLIGVCLLCILISGCIAGIKQVEYWEQKQSRHWLERKKVLKEKELWDE